MTDLQFEIRRTLGLSPKLTAMLLLLLDRKCVTRDMIEHEFKIFTEAHVAMFKLRRRLTYHGITVDNLRGEGYYLTDEMKSKVMSLVDTAKAA